MDMVTDERLRIFCKMLDAATYQELQQMATELLEARETIERLKTWNNEILAKNSKHSDRAHQRNLALGIMAAILARDMPWMVGQIEAFGIRRAAESLLEDFESEIEGGRNEK